MVPRFVPTRRLAVVLALTAPLWLVSGTRLGASVAIAGLAVILVAAIADAALIPGRRDLDIEREIPSMLGVGDDADVRYVITSRWPRAARVEVFDRLPEGAEPARDAEPGARARALLPVGVVSCPPVTIAAHGSADRAVTIRGRTRGRHAIGPGVARVAGPLGLIERSLRLPASEPVLTVIPSTAGIRRMRLLAAQHRVRDAGLRRLRLRGEGTSFDSLREYRVGDDPRHIDWKASARRRALVSRDYAVEQGQTVLILVDGGRLMTQLAGPRPRFEYALSAALMLADVAAQSHDRVGAMVFDADVQVFVPPMRGRAAVQRLRDALVPTVARMVEPDYASAFRTLGARHRKRSLVVLFTDVIDPRASASLVAHTSRCALRHLPLVVALRNDELMATARPAPGATTASLYASAAAEELLLAREAALERMRQAGISVLDVPPQAMAPAVINRYLEIKARAAL
jgi:uncharacterized protein (DUF58 family)